MNNTPEPTLPLWKRYVVYADEDVLAFALLYDGGLFSKAFYFAAQSLEKYLKAIALERLVREGKDSTWEANEKWLKKHRLVPLAERCRDSVDVHADPASREVLERFSAFDLTSRYPMPAFTFSTADLEEFEKLLRRIRGRVPLTGVRTLLAKALRDTAGVSTEIFVNPFTRRILTDLTTRMWAGGGIAARRVFGEPDALLVEGEEASRAS